MEPEKNIDEYGRYVTDTTHAFQLLLEGKNIDGVYFRESSEELSLYGKHACQVLGHNNLYMVDDIVTFDEFHDKKTKKWFIPEEYDRIDMREFLFGKCNCDVEKCRVEEEYLLFEKCGLVKILNVIHYFVEMMKKNNVIIGVGRGSSSSVFILYLLGLHRVNSIEYNLDYRDFFKEE